MANVQEMISQMMRKGKLPGGRPVKTLAVVDGETFEKDHSLMRNDLPIELLRNSIASMLPTLPKDGSMVYSFTYIADERVAYTVFERRKRGFAQENESEEEEDAAILERCIICNKTTGLMRCSRCKHVAYCCKDHQVQHWKGAGNKYGRGAEWAHKTSCPKMAGQPLRLDLDGISDDTLMNSLPVDFTYGFVLVKKLPSQKNN